MGNIINGAARAFPDTKIPLEEEFFRNVIEVCANIYRGEPPWAYVKRSGLYGKGERRISQLGCAKVLCDSLASLTFSSQADISCKSPAQQEYAMRILQENGFWEKAPAFFSRAYALGGGAMKIYIDGGRVSIDYVSAEDFIPVGSGRGGICEGIFGSRFLRGGREFALFERHGMKGGHAVIDRRLFEMKGGSLSCEIPVEEVFGGLSAPEGK